MDVDEECNNIQNNPLKLLLLQELMQFWVTLFTVLLVKEEYGNF
jgi:hypothetical protein